MLDIRNINNQILFGGAVNVKPIADRQQGPTCGFEAIENIIQLFHPVGNDLVERDLLPRALHYGIAVPSLGGYLLDFRGYQRLLLDYGIPAHWYPWDYRVIIPALKDNRGILVISDAHELNAVAYSKKGSAHAIVLTNYYTDSSTHYLRGYIGVDSNFPQIQTLWPSQNMDNAVQWASKYIAHWPVLITAHPINWANKSTFYKMTSNREIVPV